MTIRRFFIDRAHEREHTWFFGWEPDKGVKIKDHYDIRDLTLNRVLLGWFNLCVLNVWKREVLMFDERQYDSSLGQIYFNVCDDKVATYIKICCWSYRNCGLVIETFMILICRGNEDSYHCGERYLILNILLFTKLSSSYSMIKQLII